MTGMWENTLAKIESGEMNPDTFRKGIEVYTRQITAELLDVRLSLASDGNCICPKCKTGRILFYPKVASVPMWTVQLPSSATRAKSS